MVVNELADATTLVYSALPHTRFLLGPDYILLKEEFGQEPLRVIREPIERILISVGGSDPFDLTPRPLEWVCEEMVGVLIDVVIGPFFQNMRMVEEVAARWPQRIRIH